MIPPIGLAKRIVRYLPSSKVCLYPTDLAYTYYLMHCSYQRLYWKLQLPLVEVITAVTLMCKLGPMCQGAPLLLLHALGGPVTLLLLYL